MKIVIDAFGGDNAPLEIVEGALLALKKYKDLSVVFTGDEGKIKQVLGNRTDRVEIIDAKEVILPDESPVDAIKEKKDSSLVKALEALKENDDIFAMISAGSTGAIVVGSMLKVGRIRGVSRLTMAPVLPTKKDTHVTLTDPGSNINCKPEQLCQFAMMGWAYHKVKYGVENPRVALLNIGAEAHKGDELAKATYPLLEKLPINFVGNMEAREYMSGDYDVVVADGFSGNVLLKGTEGAASAVNSLIKQRIKSSIWAMIGYALFMKKPVFDKLREKLDHNKHEGSPVLGCKKIVIKNHGSSIRETILASVTHAIQLHEKDFIRKMEELFSAETAEV